MVRKWARKGRKPLANVWGSRAPFPNSLGPPRPQTSQPRAVLPDAWVDPFPEPLKNRARGRDCWPLTAVHFREPPPDAPPERPPPPPIPARSLAHLCQVPLRQLRGRPRHDAVRAILRTMPREVPPNARIRVLDTPDDHPDPMHQQVTLQVHWQVKSPKKAPTKLLSRSKRFAFVEAQLSRKRETRRQRLAALDSAQRMLLSQWSCERAPPQPPGPDHWTRHLKRAFAAVACRWCDRWPLPPLPRQSLDGNSAREFERLISTMPEFGAAVARLGQQRVRRLYREAAASGSGETSASGASGGAEFAAISARFTALMAREMERVAELERAPRAGTLAADQDNDDRSSEDAGKTISLGLGRGKTAVLLADEYWTMYRYTVQCTRPHPRTMLGWLNIVPRVKEKADGGRGKMPPLPRQNLLKIAQALRSTYESCHGPLRVSLAVCFKYVADLAFAHVVDDLFQLGRKSGSDDETAGASTGPLAAIARLVELYPDAVTVWRSAWDAPDAPLHTPLWGACKLPDRSTVAGMRRPGGCEQAILARDQVQENDSTCAPDMTCGPSAESQDAGWTTAHSAMAAELRKSPHFFSEESAMGWLRLMVAMRFVHPPVAALCLARLQLVEEADDWDVAILKGRRFEKASLDRSAKVLAAIATLDLKCPAYINVVLKKMLQQGPDGYFVGEIAARRCHLETEHLLWALAVLSRRTSDRATLSPQEQLLPDLMQRMFRAIGPAYFARISQAASVATAALRSPDATYIAGGAKSAKLVEGTTRVRWKGGRVAPFGSGSDLARFTQIYNTVRQPSGRSEGTEAAGLSPAGDAELREAADDAVSPAPPPAPPDPPPALPGVGFSRSTLAPRLAGDLRAIAAALRAACTVSRVQHRVGTLLATALRLPLHLEYIVPELDGVVVDFAVTEVLSAFHRAALAEVIFAHQKLSARDLFEKSPEIEKAIAELRVPFHGGVKKLVIEVNGDYHDVVNLDFLPETIELATHAGGRQVTPSSFATAVLHAPAAPAHSNGPTQWKTRLLRAHGYGVVDINSGTLVRTMAVGDAAVARTLKKLVPVRWDEWTRALDRVQKLGVSPG